MQAKREVKNYWMNIKRQISFSGIISLRD